MKANETQSNAKSDDHTFEKVYDRQRRRVRGLWLRSDTYYVQMVVDCQTKRIALHAAQTVSEAVSARQVLKDKISNGSYQAETSKKLAPADDRSLTAAISGYQSTRHKLGGGKSADDRNVDFHAKLENHPQLMCEHRDKTRIGFLPATTIHSSRLSHLSGGTLRCTFTRSPASTVRIPSAPLRIAAASASMVFINCQSPGQRLARICDNGGVVAEGFGLPAGEPSGKRPAARTRHARWAKA